MADIFVVNTCSVTNMADSKSRQIIRRAKKINPEGIVVGIGCYIENIMQEENKIKNSFSIGKGIKENKKEIVYEDILSNIDIIIGNHNKSNIVKIIEEYIRAKDDCNYTSAFSYKNINDEKDYQEYGTNVYITNNRAFVKIEDGCNHFCTYCIIPYLRGRVRSRDNKMILEEIKKLSQKGIKEVVLTGIHIASFEKTEEGKKYDLINLLEDIDKIEGIERIRLGSMEPRYLNSKNIERLKDIKKLCHHFHLSLQSACNNTLKRMNRKYSIEEFMEIAEELKRSFEDTILTTDIIVGFPGETEEDFKTTFNNLKKIDFYHIHVFKYSKRDGTPAAEFPNQISPEIQDIRSKEITKISEEGKERQMKNQIGKIKKVLFEEIKEGYLKGHTSNYIMINVKLDNKEEMKNYINTIKNVEITEYKKSELFGEIKKNL